MTVDLLAATFFWPESTAFGALHPYPHEVEPGSVAPGRALDPPEAADAAARAEGFWAAMVRHLWCPSDTPALP